ncbi:ABC-three component system middle component 2 [Clostridium sp. D53t1_180928_C8]|uniref:ABC-three component system middle component 2 n=1 Tax=Clostridium sp. D53t1_180928_C8 TaxID=2787101 RepID=UPI0018A901FF|nr:ABC-three component system middle component 2 [Clostridium sp. D53t1_180928_C8]
MNNKRIYNNIYEIASRLLVILNRFECSLDVQQLIYYDYLLIYAHEFSSEGKNVHPANPGHKREVYSKRRIIMDALKLLVSKHLITVSYSKDGFSYKKTCITNKFLECFQSDYYSQLNKNSILIYNEFKGKSLIELEQYMKNILSIEDDEYDKEDLFRGGYFERTL